MYYQFFLIISPWKEGGVLHLNRLESPSTMKFGWNRPSSSGEEDFWTWSMCFRYSLGKGRAFISTNLNPFTQGCIVPNLVRIDTVVLEKILKFCQCILDFLYLSTLGNKVEPFIWTNLNPLYPRILCAKFGWNWSSGSGEEGFWISLMYYHYFLIISPLEIGWSPSLENLNSLQPWIWLKSAQWFWRRFSNFVNVF